MNRLLAVLGCLVLLAALIAHPTAATAQDPLDEGDYTQFDLGDGAFTLFYPSSWTVDLSHADKNRINFVSDPSLLELQSAPLESGDVMFLLTLFVNEDGSEVDVETALASVLHQLQPNLAEEGGARLLNASSVSLMPAIEGRPEIARATYNIGDAADGLAYFWQISDELNGLAFVNTAVGESALQEPVVITMIHSVRQNISLEELYAASTQTGGN